MVNPKLMVVESHWNPNHSADYHLIISALSHHHVTIMPPWNQHSSFHISIHFIYPYIKHGLLENPPFFMNIFEEATLKWCFFPWLVWQNHSECGKPNFSKTIPKASPFLYHSYGFYVYHINVGKTTINQPFGNGLYMFIPPFMDIYGDLGDGLLLFYHVLPTSHGFSHGSMPIWGPFATSPGIPAFLDRIKSEEENITATEIARWEK